MAETPGPVARLDDYLATVTFVHEAIWELRTAAVVVERDHARVHEWFREAAELVVVELPALLHEARRLRDLWSEQDVLDPAAATDTLRLQADELDRADPAMRTLRERQNDIVRELRRFSDDSV
jgi:hypothetical protein